MTRAYWEFLVHGEELQAPIPSTKGVQRVRRPFQGGRGKHVEPFSVARVRPRTSKGITDLLLLNLARLNAASPSKKSGPTGRGRDARLGTRVRDAAPTDTLARAADDERRVATPRPTRRTHRPEGIGRLFSRPESRSLSELTRQIAPPTKNGHAPPPTESRKSSQSVNPHGVRAWKGAPC